MEAFQVEHDLVDDYYYNYLNYDQNCTHLVNCDKCFGQFTTTKIAMLILWRNWEFLFGCTKKSILKDFVGLNFLLPIFRLKIMKILIIFWCFVCVNTERRFFCCCIKKSLNFYRKLMKLKVLWRMFAVKKKSCTILCFYNV